MVEPVSAIFGLVSLGGSIAKRSHGFIERWRDCPRRVKHIDDDLNNTLSLLDELNAALGAQANAGIFSLQSQRDKFAPVFQALEEYLMLWTSL